MKIWLFLITLALSPHVSAASVEEKRDSHTYTFKDYHKEFEEERKEAEARGFARGEARGREEAIQEVLNNLKAIGKSPEYAAEVTKLSIEQVRQFYAKTH